MACLTTTIGLTNANGEYYKNTYRVPFTISATVIMSLTALISNVGLETIIEVSLPAILILCPIAVSLIIAIIFMPKTVSNETRKLSMSQTFIVVIATLFGTIDALNILGKIPASILKELDTWLPLFHAHASWLLPVLATVVISKVIHITQRRSDVVTQ